MMLVILMTFLVNHNFVTGTDYLIAVHRNSFMNYVEIEATSDKTGGSVFIEYPNHHEHKNILLPPDSKSDIIKLKKEIGTGTNLGYDHNTVLVSCSNNATRLIIHSDNFKKNIFSPLPSTALGRIYVVSSCSQKDYANLLVVAAFKQKATVQIKFEADVGLSYGGRGYGRRDTLVLSLESYQTFTLKVNSDLSGTSINSSEIIAVFSGTANSTFVNTYTQLLPVEQFSREFVLSVDGHDSHYHLQVVGAHKGFNLTFHNGSTTSTNGNIIDRQLEKNETFIFTTTDPVMATVCRKSSDQAGFGLLPPVSLYPDQRRLPVIGTTVIVAPRTAVINVTDKDVTSEWKTIRNYKIGKLTSKYLRFINLDESSHVPGMILTFRQDSFYISGVASIELQNIDNINTYINININTYIVVVPNNMYKPYITAIGSKNTTYQVVFPHKNCIRTRTTHSHSADRFHIPSDMTTETGLENKTILVKTNMNQLHIFLQSYERRTSYVSVPLLPASSLGNTYIIPFDDIIDSYDKLIIATGEDERLVDIDVTTGSETLSERLGPYQTFSRSFPSGSVISATQNIAVYLLQTDQFSNLPFFKQLMPETKYGKEYVASTGNLRMVAEYYIVITCIHKGTEIFFSDGDNNVTVGKQFYQKDLTSESIYFRSSKPVMASLCLRLKMVNRDRGSPREFHERQCVLLPPVELYDKSSVINSLGSRTTLKIVTKQANRHFHIECWHGSTLRKPLTVSWRNISNSDYKLGTAVSDDGNIFLQSSERFSVISYDVNQNKHPYGFLRYGNHWHSLAMSTSLIIGAAENRELTLNSDNSRSVAIGGSISGLLVLILLAVAAVLVYRKCIARRNQMKTSTQRTSHEPRVIFRSNPADTVPVRSRITEPIHRADPNYSDLTEGGAGENLYEPIKESEYINL